jgi:hypothetical protein
VVPAAQLADQQQARPRAALVAVVGTGAVTIVEPEAIFAAAHWARPVLVGKKAGFDAKLRQDFLPPPSCALNGVHRRAFA